MKYTFVLCIVLIIAGAVTAQQQVSRGNSKNSAKVKKGKYKMEQLIGRWQETEKWDQKAKEKISVTDTFYIHFHDNGTADTKQGNSVVITGTSDIYTDDYITTSANDFKIVTLTPAMMVLDDLRGFRHTFSRKDLFAYEVEPVRPTPVVDTAKAIIDFSSVSLIKDWFAYKREAAPGFVKPGTAVIRNLKILQQQSQNNFKGEIQFARFGKATVEACTLIFTNNMVSIVTEGDTWNMEVFKADGREMIMGKKNELVYYFQHEN